LLDAACFNVAGILGATELLDIRCAGRDGCLLAAGLTKVDEEAFIGLDDILDTESRLAGV